SITSPTLENGATYVWGVDASNSAGFSNFSPLVYFTVNTGGPPPPPPSVNPFRDYSITIRTTMTFNGIQTLANITVNVPIVPYATVDNLVDFSSKVTLVAPFEGQPTLSGNTVVFTKVSQVPAGQLFILDTGGLGSGS